MEKTRVYVWSLDAKGDTANFAGFGSLLYWTLVAMHPIRPAADTGAARSAQRQSAPVTAQLTEGAPVRCLVVDSEGLEVIEGREVFSAVYEEAAVGVWLNARSS